MAVCAPKIGTIATYYVGPFYIEDKACTLTGITRILLRNGVAYGTDVEFWINSNTIVGELLYLGSEDVEITTPLVDPALVKRVLYKAWVGVGIDFVGALRGANLSAQWTMETKISFTDCVADSVACTYVLKEKFKCVADSLSTLTYAMDGSSAAAYNVFRFYLSSRDRTKEFWREVLTNSFDGGVGNNSQFDIKNFRIDADDDVIMFLDTDAGFRRFHNSTLRGKIQRHVLFDERLIYDTQFDLMLDGNRIIAAIDDGGANDVAVVSWDYDGNNEFEIWKPGVSSTMAAPSGVVYNWDDGFIWFGQQNGNLAKVKLDGTGYVQVGNNGGSWASVNVFWHYISTYGTNGGILLSTAANGFMIYDIALDTYNNISTQYTGDLKADVYESEQLIHILGRTGVPPANEDKNRLTTYTGGSPEDLLDAPNSYPSDAWKTTNILGGLTTIEQQVGYFLRVTPNLAFDEILEVFEDVARSNTAEVGDGVASIVNQGVKREAFEQSTVTFRPIYEKIVDIGYLSSKGTRSLSLTFWDPGAYLNVDEISIYLVMRPGIHPGATTAFFEVTKAGDSTIKIGFYTVNTIDLSWRFGAESDSVTVAMPIGWENDWHLVELHVNSSTDLSELIVGGIVLHSVVRVGSDVALSSSETLYLLTNSTPSNADIDLVDMIIYAWNHDEDTRNTVRVALKQKYESLNI